MKAFAVALGDSLIYGYPYGPEASWVRRASELSGQKLINAGQNGATGSDLIPSFPRSVLPHDPSYVIIGTGTNEALRGESLSSYERNLGILQELAGQHGITPIFILPIPILSSEEQHLAELRTIIHEQSCATLNFYRPFLDARTRTPDPRWYVDWIHPTRAGYRRLAAAYLAQAPTL